MVRNAIWMEVRRREKEDEEGTEKENGFLRILRIYFNANYGCTVG